MLAVNLAIISLYVVFTIYADDAVHPLKRSELTKKDKFSITGEVTTHGNKAELNIHVESMDSKANQKKLEKAQNSLKSTQKPPNSMPRGSPTSPVGNTAGAVTTKQAIISPSKKTTKSAKANSSKGQSTTQGGVLSTKNPPLPGKQIKPTSQVTNSATSSQVTSSTRIPVSQKPNSGTIQTSKSSSASSTPSKKVKSLGNTAAAASNQNKATPSLKPPISKKPSTTIGPTSQNPAAANKQPSATGNQNQVTLPSLSKAKPSGKTMQTTSKSKHQQPSNGPGPTKNTSLNKPTSMMTNGAGITPPNNNPSSPTSQKPSQRPVSTKQSRSISTQKPTVGQQNTPTAKVISRVGNAATKPVNLPTPTKPISSGKPSGRAQGKAFQVTPKPTKNAGPISQGGGKPTTNPPSKGNQHKPTNVPSKPIWSKSSPTQTKPASIQPGSFKTSTQVPPTSGLGSNPPTQKPNQGKGTTAVQPSGSGKAVQVTSKPMITFSKAEKMALAAHNAFRKTHLSQPMKLVQDLVYEARKMAEKLASEESLTHQATNVLNKENEGESLAKICSKSNLFNPHSIIQHVVEAWYAEVCRYNFEDPDPASKETAHFSQLVWNASNELGIGVAQKDVNDEHCWFIVARYRPQGNKDGKEEFKRNVKKGTFDPIVNNCVSISDEM